MSDSPTPDAITAAFREARENDPEPLVDCIPHPAAPRTHMNRCRDCGWHSVPHEDVLSARHEADCPWLRRMAALDKCEQKVREIMQPLEQIGELQKRVETLEKEKRDAAK